MAKKHDLSNKKFSVCHAPLPLPLPLPVAVAVAVAVREICATPTA
jgi:hypothetical protein